MVTEFIFGFRLLGKASKFDTVIKYFLRIIYFAKRYVAKYNTIHLPNIFLYFENTFCAKELRESLMIKYFVKENSKFALNRNYFFFLNVE